MPAAELVRDRRVVLDQALRVLRRQVRGQRVTDGTVPLGVAPNIIPVGYGRTVGSWDSLRFRGKTGSCWNGSRVMNGFCVMSGSRTTNGSAKTSVARGGRVSTAGHGASRMRCLRGGGDCDQ